ncbi:MAG: 6-phosphogluconolactonase, partial [Pseudomonadota bacterium]
MRRLVEYPDRDVLMLDVADTLAGELADCLRRHDSASFCVPGGTTPGPVFDVLSEQALDWDRVAVFLNDERWVDEASPRSNTALVRQHLLTSKAAAAQFVPLKGPGATPEDDLPALEAGFDGHLPISVLVLGMGTDMHTAGLIPDAEGLAEALAPQAGILAPIRVPGSGEARITLTAQVLN